MPLTITILGGGISGLTAALGLRQKGHYVTILEKSSFLQEAGAAIHLGPNCSGILYRLGMEPELVGANLMNGMAHWTGEGETKSKIDLREVNKQWTNPWLLIHRKDLHQELKRLALSPDGIGLVPQLHLGCVASEIDAGKGTVRLDDGRSFQSDVIIGADGNFSFARRYVEPETQPFAWGKSCYRWLVPRDQLLSDPETAELVNEEGWFGQVCENDRRFIMYPCRNNAEMNFAAFVPNEEAGASGGDWNQKGNKDTVLKAFKNLFPAAKKLLSYAPEDVRMWQLYDMNTLHPWTRARVALIGDAAHPFLPFLGQGGAMAIEDAASIAQILPTDTVSSEVPERLKLYENVRHERATWIQDQTRINGMDEDKRPEVKGGLTMLAYCHNHDEWTNSAARLQKWLHAKQGANGLVNGAEAHESGSND